MLNRLALHLVDLFVLKMPKCVRGKPVHDARLSFAVEPTSRKGEADRARNLALRFLQMLATSWPRRSAMVFSE